MKNWDIRDVWYRAGNCNAGPDTLSRKPTRINLLTEQKKLQQETARDETLQLLVKYIRMTFPSTRSQIPMPTHAFWNARMHLSERNNLVYFGDRVVIPAALR